MKKITARPNNKRPPKGDEICKKCVYAWARNCYVGCEECKIAYQEEEGGELLCYCTFVKTGEGCKYFQEADQEQ